MGIEQSKPVLLFACDGPKCSTEISWELTNEPGQIPDAGYRIITLQTIIGPHPSFCGKTCLLDFLRDYQPHKSPREQEEADKIAARRVVQFPKKEGDESEPVHGGLIYAPDGPPPAGEDIEPEPILPPHPGGPAA